MENWTLSLIIPIFALLGVLTSLLVSFIENKKDNKNKDELNKNKPGLKFTNNLNTKKVYE